MSKRRITFTNQLKSSLFIRSRSDTIKTLSLQKDKEVANHKKIFIFIFFVNPILIAIIILFRKRIPPEVPLFYGLPEGEEQLVKAIFLTVPVIFVIFFSIFNFSISFFIKDKFVKEILIYSLIFLSFFSFVSIIKIIFLVGNF